MRFTHRIHPALVMAALLLIAAARPAVPQAESFTTLHVFGSTNLANPFGGLLLASDGNFYGMSESGGANGSGAVFRFTPTGAPSLFYSFSALSNGANFDGAQPMGALVQGADGSLYGTASAGGPSGQGTVFKILPSGALTVLKAFNGTSGATPYAGLTIGADGNLYGSTVYGGSSMGAYHGLGTLFQITPGGSFTTLHVFDGSDGAYPCGKLLQASDGSFYGTTFDGGSNGFYGVVFQLTHPSASPWSLTPIHSFAGFDGAAPFAGLTLGQDGALYGTTLSSGKNGYGTVYKLVPGGSLTSLYSFGYTDGAAPYAGLTQLSNGSFYGTTAYGGFGDTGTAFTITPAGKLNTLYQFTAPTLGYTNPDGELPIAGLTPGSDGNLYGATCYGGVGGSGTLFQLTPSGAFTSLGSFTIDGAEYFSYVTSDGQLVLASDGNLYGCTYAGGAYLSGTVYRMPVGGGPVTTIYSFTGGNDGSNPNSGLIQATDGSLYGTTKLGGTYNYGVVFRMSLDGSSETNLHSFNDNIDGAFPNSIMQASDGNLYGTVFEGSGGGNGGGGGTVFQMTLSGNFTTLYNFEGGPPTWYGYPRSPLLEASDGNLYGTTNGNANGYGTIFRIPMGDTPTTPTILYNFTAGSDGAYPIGALALGRNLDGSADGNLYGLTSGSGAGNSSNRAGNGSVYMLSLASGTLTPLYTFPQPVGAEGAQPIAGLYETNDGNLYGTTSIGGANGYGTVFEIGRGGGALTTLYSFTGASDGATPNAALFQAPDARLYGTTSAGGVSSAPNGIGTIFSLPTLIPVPALTSIDPNTAIAGNSGFTLTATGKRFVNGATVDWNGTALTTTFLSDTQLTANVPSSLISNPGTATVTIVDPGGTVSGGIPFTITSQPFIMDITPDSAVVGSPTVQMTVNGESFQNGATVNWSFEFGNATALMTTYVSSTQLTAAIPASLLTAPGIAFVTITNPDGTTSDPAAFLVNNPPPTLTSLSPTSIPAGSAAFTLTLQGSSFVTGDRVLWNNTLLPATVVGSAGTQLTTTIPASLIVNVGTVQISVTDNSGNTSASLPFTITTPTLVLKSLSPTSLTHGSKASTLTLTGTGFAKGAVVNWNTSMLTTKFVSSTKLTASIPASDLATKGTAQVSVTNPSGGGTSHALTFTIK